MQYLTFLDSVIKRGIEAATRDYAKHPEKLAGAISGFQACRDKSPGELRAVLESARTVTSNARLSEPARFWFRRCYEAEVEWVCNCVSALLYTRRQALIVPPTARAMITVAQIVGVAAPD